MISSRLKTHAFFLLFIISNFPTILSLYEGDWRQSWDEAPRPGHSHVGPRHAKQTDQPEHRV